MTAPEPSERHRERAWLLLEKMIVKPQQPEVDELAAAFAEVEAQARAEEREAFLRQPDHGHEPQHGDSMREVLEEIEATPEGPNEMRCVLLTGSQWETLRRWIHTMYVDALNHAIRRGQP